MSLQMLISRFENEESAPILVDDIKAYIISCGFCDEIQFMPSEMNSETVKGFIRRFSYHKVPYGDPILAANVYFSSELNDCWRRLVCAKELVHILDKQSATVNSIEKLNDLLVGLTSSLEYSQLGDQAKSDIAAEIKALPVLIPLVLRNKLKVKYDSQMISDHDVAYFFRVPKKYVPLVMSDTYDSVVRLLSTRASI